MVVYKDVITGDVLFSVECNIQLVDDSVYLVDCNVGNDEEGELENIVEKFNLQPVSYDKRSFMVQLKGYMKSVTKYLQQNDPSTAEHFETGVQTYLKGVHTNLGDYDFYTGASKNPNGMVILINSRGDGSSPYALFWKHGVIAEF